MAGAGAGRLALEAELNTLLLGFLLQDLVPLHTRQEVVTAFRVLKKEITGASCEHHWKILLSKMIFFKP